VLGRAEVWGVTAGFAMLVGCAGACLTVLDDGCVDVGVDVGGWSVSVGVELGVVAPAVGAAADGGLVTAALARWTAVPGGAAELACVEVVKAGADVGRWTADVERAPGVLMCSASPPAALVSGVGTIGSLCD
jgi:hypothetical protein